MSEEIDLEKDYEELKKVLDQFVESKKTAEFKKKKLASSFLKYLKRRTEMLDEEDTFQVPNGIEVKRGKVFWVDFGVNVGEELGGKHPAIVLRVGGKTAIVVPLSSQEPTDRQKASGAYIEVDKVYGFKDMKRWVNVLNTMPVSLQRFDFDSSSGNVKGYILDRLNNAVKQCGLWR